LLGGKNRIKKEVFVKSKKLVSKEYLTWDMLAEFFKKKTGGIARTKPMSYIYKWAVKQPEIKVTECGLLFKM
jgi:hypothetical protein